MTDELRKLAEAASEPHDAWYGHNELRVAVSGHAASLIAASSPAAVLALLDERDEARAAVKRLGTVLNIIAGYNPEVTHGWADDVREMARAALDDPVVRRIVEE